jgi:single-strand DNA-binding protein
MNKVILMGRLTRDPEVRYTSTNNTLVASFSLAVNRRFARQGEERQADFINITAWDKTGEFCSKYFKKGQQVGIIGRIQTRNYDDKDGKKVYVTEVVAEEAYFADSKREGEAMGNPFGGNQMADAPFNANNAPSDFNQVTDDDLPF